MGAGAASLVTFAVGDQHYAVDSRRVREITGRHALARVPHAPASLPGVMNLRGAVVPVMDLARRLEVEGGGEPDRNVLVVEVPHPEGPWSLGLLVREVLDVREADLSRAQAAPELGRRGARFTSGLLPEEDGGALRLLDLGALADSLQPAGERQSLTARGM